MANTDFIFNLAFKVTGDESVEKVQKTLGDLVTAQQRVTATSARQGQSQRKLTEENRKLAKQTQDFVHSLNRQRGQLEKGTAAYRKNNVATAAAERSLKTLNDTNNRYNSSIQANQKREQRRKESIIASAGATQKLEQSTKSFISSLGQSTSMTERNIHEATQLISKIDEQIASNQKLQRSVGLTRKQQASLVKEEQRLIKTKESLQNRVSGTANRFEQFKRTAAAARADLQRLSADNLRASETTQAHKDEQQRLEQVLEELSIEFKMLSEAGELSEQQMTQMSQALAGVKGQALQTDRNLKGMSQAFTGQTKAVNSANQILLSFGDIAQDSAQFQFGFAQGMRAIGNNITFAAEQFTIFAAKVAAANDGTFRMRDGVAVLKKSLTGVGGLIILLNIAVTAITVLSSSMRKNKKEAEDMADSNSRLNEVIKTQISRLQDAREEMDNMFSKESIRGRTQALTIERDRNNEVLSFLQNEAKLLSDKTDYRKMLQGMDEEQIAAMRELDIIGFEQRRFDTETIREKRKRLLSLVDSELGSRQIAQQKLDIVNEEIDAIKQRNQEIDEGFYRLNLEERALGDINVAKKEGLDIDKERSEFIVPSVSDPLLLEDSIKASRELDMFRAEQTANELERATKIRDLRIQDAEDRRFTLEISETRERLIKEQAEQEYQDTVKELRNQEMQDEINRRNQMLEMEREHADLRLSIEQQLASSRMQVNQMLVTSLQSSFSALFGQNKAVALLSLAVEKGLAIAKVIADSRENAAELEAESVKLASIGAAYSITLNPLASQYFAASATAKAGAVKTLAVGKKNAAKIAAIGLLQGAGALSGGGGGGGATGGAGASGSQFGMQTVEGEQRFRTPQYQPRRAEDSRVGETNVQIMADRKQLYALVNKGQQEYNSIRATT